MASNEAAFLLNLVQERPALLLELEQYAKEHRVPIMEPVSMQFLTNLIRIHQPKRVLEIGSAIGYSALRMHAAYENSKIITIEREKHLAEIAKAHIFACNKQENIEVIHADALAYIKELDERNEQFDFIFIDAAKAQYKNFFETCRHLIHKNGIIVCDNVLFKGYVANPDKDDNVRMQKLANKIRAFLHWLVEQEQFHTSIIPIGDGISISIKK